jgi:chromosome segregation ATPase
MAPSASSPTVGSYGGRATANGRSHHTNGNSDRSANTEVKSPSENATRAIETIQQTFENALAAITILPEENRTLKAQIIELKAKLAIFEAEKGKVEKIAAKAQSDLVKERKKHVEQNEKLHRLASNFTTQYETFKAGHEKKHEGKQLVLEETNVNKEEDNKSTAEIKSLQQKLLIDRKTYAKEKEAWEEKHDFLARIRDLGTEISSLEIEHRQTLGAADRRNADLFLLNSKLELELNNLKKQKKTKKKPTLKIEGYESIAEMYHRNYHQLNRQWGSLHEELAEIKEDLVEAQLEMVKIQPLLQKAVDARMCFLAQAKEDVMDSAAEESDKVAIKAGNAAVYRADGEADALMFTAGLVRDPEAWSLVFEELYGAPPHDYHMLANGCKRYKDCEVAIRMDKSLMGGRGPTDLREEAKRYLQILYDHYDGELFRAEELIEDVVDELERVTERLVGTSS